MSVYACVMSSEGCAVTVIKVLNLNIAQQKPQWPYLPVLLTLKTRLDTTKEKISELELEGNIQNLAKRGRDTKRTETLRDMEARVRSMQNPKRYGG